MKSLKIWSIETQFIAKVISCVNACDPYAIYKQHIKWKLYEWHFIIKNLEILSTRGDNYERQLILELLIVEVTIVRVDYVTTI